MCLRIGLLVLSMSFFALSGAEAKTVTVDGDEPRKRITLRIDSASLDYVLTHIGKKYGFDVKGLKHLGTREALSMTISGTLHRLLSRLLKNRNYVIVRSANNLSGVERVLILDAKYGVGSGTRSNGEVVLPFTNRSRAKIVSTSRIDED